jgi:tetratricopeptide (TPR) repeat protein
MAQCYLLSSDDVDWPRAEATLLAVVGGNVLQPDSPQFRAALIELGEMYRRIGQYSKAIERISEVTERYADLADDPRMISALAEANRLSASEIRRRLRESMPQSERQTLEKLERDRLAEAMRLYDRARVVLDTGDQKRRSELDRVLLRNAVFYRGDCAYDLGEASKADPQAARPYFEMAIRYYDSAAQRYAEDPSSLVAMIQIVNSYAALGKWREAQTAHERARARLAELPASAWDRDDKPMRREHWERWLEAGVQIDRLQAAAAPDAGQPG